MRLHLRPRVASLLCLFVAFGACSRAPATSGTDAAPSTSVSPSKPAPSSSPDGSTTTHAVVAVAPVEARRAHLTRFAEDPMLASSIEVLDKHFAGGSPSGFDVQNAELTVGGRHALLITESAKPAPDSRPIAIVTDERGSIAWTKGRPAAGILQPIGPLAISGGPQGRVALAVCDPPTKTVALRLWDDDGSPFADFQALDTEGCGAVSLLYWPRVGWVIVAVLPGATRAQLVTENGSLAWGRGRDVGARSRPQALAPASIAADTSETFVLVQVVRPSAAEASPFVALAFRYDTHGTAIWPAAVDLGQLPRPPSPNDRVVLTQLPPAGVHASLRGMLEADVRPSGDVTPRGRAPQ